jgi:hypothetical protein
MQYILPSKEKYMLITCSIVTALLILGFTFGDTLSEWKESVKAKVRKWLHNKIATRSIDGDSANTSVGFVSVLVKFIDEHFLKPSDEITYGDSGLVHDEKEEEEEEEEEDEVEKEVVKEEKVVAEEKDEDEEDYRLDGG